MHRERLLMVWLAAGCGGAPASSPAPLPTTHPSAPAPAPAPKPAPLPLGGLELKGRILKPETMVVLPPPDATADPHEREVRRAAAEAEQRFDEAHDPPSFAAARDAYRQAIALAGDAHPLSGFLRYKLAWTLFRMDAFPDAFEAFWTLIDFAPAQDFRHEALEYLAILVAEPGWQEGGKSGFERPTVASHLAGSQAWIPELLATTGQVFSDTAEYANAARAYDLAAARSPDAAARQELTGKADQARARLKP